MDRVDYLGMGSVALVALALIVFIIYQFVDDQLEKRRKK